MKAVSIQTCIRDSACQTSPFVPQCGRVTVSDAAVRERVSKSPFVEEVDIQAIQYQNVLSELDNKVVESFNSGETRSTLALVRDHVDIAKGLAELVTSFNGDIQKKARLSEIAHMINKHDEICNFKLNRAISGSLERMQRNVVTQHVALQRIHKRDEQESDKLKIFAENSGRLQFHIDHPKPVVSSKDRLGAGKSLLCLSSTAPASSPILPAVQPPSEDAEWLRSWTILDRVVIDTNIE